MEQRWSAKTAAGMAWGIVSCVVLLLPWWRNHALLRDFYDYGNIIAGVGRMQLGERPYVDFLTPIQTLQFWVGVLAERLWGAEYLSLTYAAALFTAGMFALLGWLLARSLGGGLALLLSAAVVAASAVQHTIIWYNAMGVAWLAVAVWLSARAWGGDRSRVAVGAGVVAALWLGGMTKLTYHVGAVAFVVLFVLRGSGREITKTTGALLIAGSAAAATVLPIATEMMLTGASFSEWKKNVLELASSRTDLLRSIATWRFYWHTPHDYYRPLYMPFVGGWGVVLALAVGGAAVWRLKREKADGREWGFLAVAWGGAMACGLAFLALHLEIAYLAGAAWLVLATGLVLAFVPRAADGPSRLARGALAVGAITLLVPAWASAWSGARAIWGHRPLVRAALVSANDLPARFSYLRGMRILPEWHASLHVLDRVQQELKEERIEEDAWYFVNGTEWLVRAMPEARQGGLPLWLQYGTTVGDAEVASIVRRMERASEIKVIVSHHPWAKWPRGLEPVLNERFRAIDAGPEFVTLRVRSELDWPLQFAERFNSNLYARDLEISGGALEMRGRFEEPFFGAHETARLTMRRGVYRLSGDFVSELAADEAEGPVALKFRARTIDGEGPGPLLWDEEVVLTRERPVMTRPFSISPGGRRVELEVELPPGRTVFGGWRNLQTQHAGEAGDEMPQGVVAGLRVHGLGAAERAALGEVADSAEREIVVRGEVAAARQGGGLGGMVPAEIWMRLGETDTQVSGEFRVEMGNGAESPARRVRVVVAYYKSGRFDRLYEREIGGGEDSGGVEMQRFNVGVRERAGWVVLLAVMRDGPSDAEASVYWSKVSVR